MKKLSDAYINFKVQAEKFLWTHVIPPFFKLILLGIQITLAWAFYEMVVNIVDELS